MTDQTRRLETLDILRGFALFGMIIVHFHQRFRLSMPDIQLMPGENLVGWIVWMGMEQKSMAIFALLFGAGSAILLRRAELQGKPLTGFYLRRLAVLAMIGLLVEIFTGFSVLVHYAIWGVPLLLIRNWSTRSLIGVALLAATASSLLSIGTGLYELLNSDAPEAAAAAARAAQAAPSTYADQIAQRLARAQRNYVQWRVVIPSTTFTLFIIGLLAIRHRIFDDPRQHVRRIRIAMGLGLISWLAYWFLLPHVPTDFAPKAIAMPVRYGFNIINDQWLGFTYAGALVLLLAYRPRWTLRLAPFAHAGRMPLTNYIVQAAVIDWLSPPVGLALKLRPYAYVASALLLFVVLSQISRWWLGHFRYGPVEWLWRSLSNSAAAREP